MIAITAGTHGTGAREAAAVTTRKNLSPEDGPACDILCAGSWVVQWPEIGYGGAMRVIEMIATNGGDKWVSDSTRKREGKRLG